MSRLFPEFENENALRTYPFASGCTVKDTSGAGIGTGVLVDAALYPVNATGTLYLSRISPGGTVRVSDSRGAVMEGRPEQGASCIELYDLSVLGRHSGTLVASSPEALSALVNVYEDRVFRASETAFASSCVFPVANDGVLSLDVGGTGAVDGELVFANGNSDPVRVSTDLEGRTLRFDVVPVAEAVELASIQHVFCVVDGRTPFRIEKLPFDLAEPDIGNTVAVYLDGLERRDICNNVHREDTLEMVDTCDCESSGCPTPEPPVEIPEAYQTAVVDIPNGSDSAFYLAVPNMTGYDNPLSLTLEDGLPVPNTDPDVGADKDNVAALADHITSKGTILQVPGLAAT